MEAVTHVKGVMQGLIGGFLSWVFLHFCSFYWWLVTVMTRILIENLLHYFLKEYMLFYLNRYKYIEYSWSHFIHCV